MVEERVQRRLAAILMADMVGYSRLMTADETGTLKRLKALRAEAIDPKIAEHQGRIVKEMGDGLLVEFASVVDAVRCGTELQQGLAERNADESEDRWIEFRIGINLGDIIVEDDDIYGDGVNIAARLQTLAEPGGICVSRTVFDHVKGKLELRFDDLGEHEVKNIAEPVRIFRVELDNATRTSRTETLLTRPAVAVLPFANLGGDPEQEYFADGLTEDIITALSYWRWFPVIARNSTFAYKEMAQDVTRVARELGARYVLEGSVRKAGSKVRVSAQLIDGASGHHIWAQRYDRDLTDIFELQDEITRQIVATIEPELNRAEQQRALRKKPESLDAWDYCLRALWHINKVTKEDNEAARPLLDKAMELDPDSSTARSLLSLCCFHDALFGFAADRAEAFAETFRAAEEAVALDDGDWLALATLGFAYLWSRGEYEPGVEAVERAIALNPSAAIAYHFLGCVLEFAGRPAEAIPHLERVTAFDPRYRFKSAALADLALSRFLIGDFEQAVESAKAAIQVQPGNIRAHQRLAATLGHLGREEEARAALEELLRLQPDFSRTFLDVTYPFKDPTHRELFLDGLHKAGWE
ncbi:MAG: adenylate/guanylate cyclase domain-containing protein, partial [Terriglobia bacterium]